MRLRTSLFCLFILVGAAGLCGNAFAQGGSPVEGRDDPLSPILWVDPTSLDFGDCVEVGQCVDLVVSIANANNDPGSILEIVSLPITGGDFSLPAPPQLPIQIAGDDPPFQLSVRFCPLAGGVQNGDLTVQGGPNTVEPTFQIVTLTGIGTEPPSCDAGGPYTGLVDEVITFDGSGSTGIRLSETILSYDWEFGDGDTGSGVTADHAYPSSGVYDVTLTVTNECQLSSSCVTTATILAEPDCAHGGPYSGQVGDSIQFDGSGSSDPDGTIVDYAWDFGDSNTGSGAMPQHTYAVASVYDVTLTVTDNDNLTSSCATTATISAGQDPICNAGGPYAGLVGIAVNFDGSGSSMPGGTIDLYEWDFGDGQNGGGVAPSHIYGTAETFTVTLTVTANTGSSASCATSAEINAPPVCDANGPYTGEQGSPVTFDGTGSFDPNGSIVSYAWDFGDTNGGSGPTPTHTYADGGTFTVTLTVEDDQGATASCATSAEINSLPLCDAGGPYEGNVGDVVQLDGSGSSDPDGTIDSYAWDFGDGNTGSGATPTNAYATNGLFVVTLTVEDNQGATSSCSTEADINAPPICDANGPYVGSPGEMIFFDGTGSSDPDGTIIVYEWDFGDGSSAGVGHSPTHAYPNAGFYTVTLIVVDDDSTAAECETTVDITPPTPVDLSFFEVLQENDVIALTWRTTREVANQGFNVLRSDVDQGIERERLNDLLIPSEGLAGDYRFDDDQAEAGHTYDYLLEAVDLSGGKEYHGPQRVTVLRLAPARLALHRNQPNPFNPSTTLSFDLPEAGHATLVIYDVAGRPVRTLLEGSFEAGVYTLDWNGRSDAGEAMASGIYFMQLRTAAGTLTHKMVMAR